MWDGEVSAIRDAITAAKLVKSVGLQSRVALLPNDKDPNEVPASVVLSAYRNAYDASDSRLIKELMLRARANQR